MDDFDLKVRAYVPTGGEEESRPLFYWIHGGGMSEVPSVMLHDSNFPSVGFVFGDIELDDLFLKTICVDLQVAIVTAEYRSTVSWLSCFSLADQHPNVVRLAPDHPFPTGLNDAYEGLKWVGATLPSCPYRSC